MICSRYNGEDELQATEEDLRALEAQEYICHLCMQTFNHRTILQEHMVTCKIENTTTTNKGNYKRSNIYFYSIT